MSKEPKSIKELRVENRWTMKQIAEQTGIPFGTYVAYDCGYRKISFVNARKLADFYGISVDDIKTE